jgi:hypothetical protein
MVGERMVGADDARDVEMVDVRENSVREDNGGRERGRCERMVERGRCERTVREDGGERMVREDIARGSCKRR